ncbi:MAG: sugar ABC transporter permease, partial [Bacteroidota bacterium]
MVTNRSYVGKLLEKMNSSQVSANGPLVSLTGRRRQNGRLPSRFISMMIGPAALIIAFVVVFPLLYSLYLSFTSYTLLKPVPNWVGLRNYVRLLDDDVFWLAFGNTLLFLFVTINLEYLFGLLLSQLLARTVRGQSILRTLLMIPMMFAPVLVGFQFRWFFNDQVGLVNNLLLQFGLISTSIPWLVGRLTAMFAIVVADTWMNTPVMTIILLAGTLSLPRELYEAAEVDGASGWQKFIHITFPLLAPFTTIAMTIRSLDVARGFDIVSIMTGGGPAHRTELLWTYVQRTAILDAKFALGSAMSYITIIVTIG